MSQGMKVVSISCIVFHGLELVAYCHAIVYTLVAEIPQKPTEMMVKTTKE